MPTESITMPLLSVHESSRASAMYWASSMDLDDMGDLETVCRHLVYGRLKRREEFRKIELMYVGDIHLSLFLGIASA